ncbi:MAG: phosphatidate cytidylyltransferase [Candidatus Omnitrophica bacterium CG08_land_8_20_14_0_20_41_16]|uniref:Phosphatidate cytidylyltransferase n=1 Tax=Candidatus Sherwoodlollariibacterium unditelluris TaxID=1974757 RepID=A0A2G9YKI2_9BACT|nr:MAG: phosphatidate cytidylyltransferase [Candidatus Omnitrophica bacterium CG23_combo_of_CG06-09_8_20_14_all_41_10]PIS33738.1 MAG: phosphatidate cytidylyltransferase [Candidatus Omnitrophica bacterium CG08_land_8_20_14_0_20_41_16]
MLTKRIASSSLLVAMIIGVIFIDWLCGLVVTLFIAAGLYEFFLMLEKKGISTYKYFGIGMGVIIPLSIMFRFELTHGWEFLFIVLALVFLIIMQFKRREHSGAIIGIATTIFGIIYISWFFSFLIKIRYLSSGLGLLASVLLITKSCDIGAYLIGSRFGKIPFFPAISPKKTFEGAIGGVGFSVFSAIACRPLLGFNYLHLIVLGISISVLAQLGDLSESLIKRDCEVKDSGNIFPGMGGVLDEIDSLLFTAPVFYFYMSVALLK